MVQKFQRSFLKPYLGLLLLFFGGHIAAQQLQFEPNSPTDGYKKGFFIEGNDTLRFRYFVPAHQQATKLGVILFLHGSGERGSDNQSQLSHGAEFLQKIAQNDTHPCIVFFPQCSNESYWSNVKRKEKNGKPIFKFTNKLKPTEAMKLLMDMTDWLQICNQFNNQHFVVGGLSMGGMGTIELVRRRPNVFCAAFPICGGGLIKNTMALQQTRFWFFHGAKDDIVPPENSETLVHQLQDAHLDVKFNLYPIANHNSWDYAFAEPNLGAWICTPKPEIIQEILIRKDR